MCIELFKQILIGGVGYSASFYLVFAQVLMSTCSEVKFLFGVLKNKSLTLRFSVLMVPLIIIITYLMASSISFGSFLSGRWDEHKLFSLVSITLTEQGVMEIMAFTAAFLILTIAFSIAFPMKLPLWLMTFGVESVAALALLVLYGGLFFREFPFTILDLCNRNLQLTRYLIYGLFCVIFKDFILVLSLVYGEVFRERQLNKDTGEELYCDKRNYYKKQSLTYLTRDCLPISLSLILFGLFAEGLLAYQWMRSPPSDPKETLAAITVVLLFGLFFILGLFLLYRRMRPQTTTAYRQLRAMGNEDVVLKLFHDEMINGTPTVQRIGFNATEFRSPHFTMRKSGIKTTIEWTGGHLPVDLSL